MHRTLRSVLALAVLGFVVAPSARAQTTTGRISGTVSDASGAVLPGVTVTVTEATTAFTKSGVTDSRGGYVFVDMPRGTYNVAAELTGFKKGREERLLAGGGRTRDRQLLAQRRNRERVDRGHGAR
jgi:hypothetical protein